MNYISGLLRNMLTNIIVFS